MKKVMPGGLAVVVVCVLVGKWLATPEPWSVVYYKWLVLSGVILGFLTGLCSGQIAMSIGGSAAKAILSAAAIGVSLMVVQLALYGALLPDFLSIPTGIPDNSEPWVLAGIGLPVSLGHDPSKRVAVLADEITKNGERRFGWLRGKPVLC